MLGSIDAASAAAPTDPVAAAVPAEEPDEEADPESLLPQATRTPLASAPPRNWRREGIQSRRECGESEAWGGREVLLMLCVVAKFSVDVPTWRVMTTVPRADLRQYRRVVSSRGRAPGGSVVRDLMSDKGGRG